MAFWGYNFIYDGVPSETYGLFLISPDGSGTTSNVGSGSVNLIQTEIYRKPKPYLFGVQQAPQLSFSLNFASEKPLCAEMQSLIQKWLLGQSQYKKLQICQDDYQYAYFNCLLTEPEFGVYGNLPYSFKCKVVCDSPFLWEFPRVITLNNIESQQTFNLNNSSDLNDYVKPVIKISLGNTTYFNIKNNTLNKTMSMSGLTVDEVITIDSELEIITSSLGIQRYDNLVGGFFKLAPKLNNLSVGDNMKQFQLTYQNARRFSG